MNEAVDFDFFDEPIANGSAKKTWTDTNRASRTSSAGSGRPERRGSGGERPAGRAASPGGHGGRGADNPHGHVTTIPTGKSEAQDDDSSDDERKRPSRQSGRPDSAANRRVSSARSGTGDGGSRRKETRARSESNSSSDRSRSRSSDSRSSRSRSSGSRSSGSRSSGSRSSSRSSSAGSLHRGSDQRDSSKQAWGVADPKKTDQTSDNKNSKHLGNRPKTAHHQRTRSTGDDRKKTRSRSHNSSSSEDTDQTLSESSSDSEMTDVSPLISPHHVTPKQSSSQRKEKRVEIYEGPSKSDRRPPKPMHKDLVNYKVRPKSAHAGGYEHLLQADKDSVNLKVLMEAILEMEREKEDDLKRSSHSKQFRVPQSPCSIAGSVSSVESPHRRNFSFSNPRVKEIDRENQRLMKEILKFAGMKKKAAVKEKPVKSNAPLAATHRLSASAVNRHREQQRIDQENKAMLRRLESAKPTKTLDRNKLKQDFNNTTYVGVPLGVIHSPKKSPKSKSPYSFSDSRQPGIGVRSRSMSSIRSDAGSLASESTMKSFDSTSTVKSRRSTGSAGTATKTKHRPKSAHVLSGTHTVGGIQMRTKRPDWEPGW